MAPWDLLSTQLNAFIYPINRDRDRALERPGNASRSFMPFSRLVGSVSLTGCRNRPCLCGVDHYVVFAGGSYITDSGKHISVAFIAAFRWNGVWEHVDSRCTD
jgi:hypothetical protein